MPHYLIISGEENWAYSIELDGDAGYRVGRAADNDIVINDRRVSSYHARLQGDGEQFVVFDLESRNGTEVNGHKVRKARLDEGDVIQMGRSSLLVSSKLEGASASGAAVLSPKLSQPLLKTELRKLHDIVDELTCLQDKMARRKLDDAGMEEAGQQLAKTVNRLREVEVHTRTLISTNHFHELFHRPLPPREIYGEAMRFIAAAVEAEDAAIVTGQVVPLETVLTVEAATGVRVVSWQSRIPTPFESLLRDCLRDKRSIHIRSMRDDARFKTEDGAEDSRSILVCPMTTPRGKVLGAGYFDNLSRPDKLTAQDAALVEGCLRILSSYIVGEDSSGAYRRTPQAHTELADGGETENQTVF